MARLYHPRQLRQWTTESVLLPVTHPLRKATVAKGSTLTYKSSLFHYYCCYFAKCCVLQMGIEPISDTSKWIRPLCRDRYSTSCHQQRKCYPVPWIYPKQKRIYLLNQSTCILEDKLLLLLQIALVVVIAHSALPLKHGRANLHTINSLWCD